MSSFNERPHQNEKNEALSYIKRLMEEARKDKRLDDLPKLEQVLNLINTKRYGLVWEEHAELVEEEMKTKIPVFIEDETRKIHTNPNSTDYNFLLEGDNLHSLHLLQKTHAGKIDVIYIDPPYNTGNKDFIYNDKFVDKTDGYAHSKWLSFMSKRLELAKDLLSETGVIFISIDDNEQANLMLLMEEIFGEQNFIAQLIWKKKKGGSNDSKYIATEHEYVIMYSKNKGNLNNIFLPHNKEYLKRYKEEDEKGRYFWDTFRRKSGKQYYPITCPDGTILQYDEDGNEISWLRSERRFYEDLDKGEVRIVKINGKWTVHFKQRIPIGKKPRSILDSCGTTSDGSSTLARVLRDVKAFDNPKPIELIQHLISYESNDTVILDFFAGSGTTGHAVAQLNKEDGGNRKYILCTNNENSICEEVTYKRLAKIQEELPHNLKYFKTQFIEKSDEDLERALLNNVETLIELEHAVDLSESDKAVAFTLSEIKELDLTGIKTVYMRQHSHALMEKKDLVRYEGIEIIDVPEYYFAKEMSEAGL